MENKRKEPCQVVLTRSGKVFEVSMRGKMRLKKERERRRTRYWWEWFRIKNKEKIKWEKKKKDYMIVLPVKNLPYL